MDTVSQFIQFPCMTLSKIPPHTHSTSSPSILPLSSINNITTNSIKKLQSFQLIRARQVFHVRAVDGYEWGPQNEEPVGEGSAEVEVEVAVAEKPKEESEIESLKKALVDSFYGTHCGLMATSETRSDIVELIMQLEAKNPTPAPTESLTLLNGKWILAWWRYTSFAGLFPLLSRGTLPLVKVVEMSQTIDSENFTVQNSVQCSWPLASTSISTNAKFEVRSPKLVQIKFEGGTIGTPQLTDSIVLPESVEFLGQKIDLTPFKETVTCVAKTISSQPLLKFSFSNSNAESVVASYIGLPSITESWSLTTYLDEDLRISRGEAGSVFVLIKEGSSLLMP